MIKKILNKFGIYKTYKIKVGNTFFKVPVFNKLGFANMSLAEPWMQVILNKLGDENSSFLDIGVNVGQTLLRWKAEYPNSNYIGVEPNVDCVSYVNKMISENGIKKAVVFPVGLGSDVVFDYLYISKTDPSDSTASTVKNFRENENRKAIPIVIVPYSVLSNTEFDIIKIDVEGGELEIIESIFKSKKCNSIFICEILPVYKKENLKRLKRQKEIENILHQNEYSIFRIMKGTIVSLEQIIEIGVHSDLEACDYLFVPKSGTQIIVDKFK